MKRFFLIAIVALIWFLPEARAQTVPVTTLTAAGTTCVNGSTTAGSFLMAKVGQNGTMGFTINANAGGNTISFFASGDGGKTYQALSVTPSNSTTTVTTATTTGIWRASVGGYSNVCMVMTTQASGNTLVTIIPSETSALGLGSAAGTGSGTVSGQASNVIPKGTASTALAAQSSITDNGTTVSTTEPLTTSNAGVFNTNGPNNYLQGIVTGGRTDCTTGLQTILGGGHVTEANIGCISTPTSGTTNGLNIGIGGYAQVNDSNAGGQFTNVEGVGEFDVAYCAVLHTHCEAGADQVFDAASITDTLLLGREITVYPQNTTTTGYGLLLNMAGATAQPTGNNMPAVVIQKPTGAATYTTGFTCEDASIADFSCIQVGKLAASGASASQYMVFKANNGGDITAGINLTGDGILNASLRPFSAGPTTVGALPSAATSSGSFITVTDSTTIVAEGQTCVGGNATPPNIALAFSNGSAWKCF